MEVCKKIKKITLKDAGVVAKMQCNKPAFENGLCKHHHSKDLKKKIRWIDRENYVEATLDDMNKGKSMKLKNTHVHTLYRFKKGIIEKYHPTREWEPTNIKPDNTQFCIKKY